jgi:hypothetical protein
MTAKADLTIVQKIEGAGPVTEVTMKIKGDKARLETGADVTTIVDTKTGNVMTLMNSQKRFIEISGDKMKAMAAMMGQAAPPQSGGEKPKLTPTGKKETINGFETEEYVSSGADTKATYWLAMNFPDGPAVLKQMQVMSSSALSASMGAPVQPDFPGVPIRSRVTVQGKEITSTMSSVKQDPIPETEFLVPKDFQKTQLPGFGGEASSSGKPKKP